MKRRDLFLKRNLSSRYRRCLPTVAISTSSEALVGCAVACSHVVLLVPDLSFACGVRHWPVFTVPFMVVPRPDFKLSSTLGLKNIASGPSGPPPHSMILQ